MPKELSPPNALFVSFMTSRMLDALQKDPEQDVNNLFASIIKEKKGYDKFDWTSVKDRIFEKVEAAAAELSFGVKKKKTQEKPVLKTTKTKKVAKPDEEEEIHLPKKMKIKKGAEQAFVGNEVFVSGRPGKVGVKCEPGFEANEREVDEHTKAYGCQRAKKGQI